MLGFKSWEIAYNLEQSLTTLVSSYVVNVLVAINPSPPNCLLCHHCICCSNLHEYFKILSLTVADIVNQSRHFCLLSLDIGMKSTCCVLTAIVRYHQSFILLHSLYDKPGHLIYLFIYYLIS